MACQELLKFSLACHVVLGEVLSVSIIHSCCSDGVKDEAATKVECNRVLSAVVPQALDSGHY